MKNKIKRGLALSLSVCAAFSVLTVSASASKGEASTAEPQENSLTYDMLARVELGLLPVGNKSVSAYRKLGVSYGGNLITRSALSVGGRAYISLRDFAHGIGASYSYSSATKVATVKYGSARLTVSNGAYVMYMNESRPIFSFANSVVMSDGVMYSPVDSLARAFGLKSVSGSDGISLSGSVRPLGKAPYSEDEIFWLARIIQAESLGESLLGKIGVGSVVMNRVKSPLYPNTIYGVIFDRKYGVQFSPILNGTIYNTPNFQSRLAAMICLEGFSISDRALFFLEPRLSTSSWIPRNREYLFSIQHHDFYA